MLKVSNARGDCTKKQKPGLNKNKHLLHSDALSMSRDTLPFSFVDAN